jgi:hypothetical protein
MGYSQKEDAQKISATLRICERQARQLGESAFANDLTWADNPFTHNSLMLRHAWNVAYSDAAHKAQTRQLTS